MKAATISEIKQELTTIAPAKLLDLLLRLSKYKKENKELLTYLLFEAHDETAYIEIVKREIDTQFAEMNLSNLYFVKKSLRKILRTTAKYIRYMGSKQAEVELLLYFCVTLINSSIPIHKSTVLNNLYQFQLKKIAKLIAALHEDLQYDYLKELKKLE
ncbi:MAG: hypothetical protein H7Z13_06010 [Ferruginibacter sp.]|nr:hypothetical protein [Ferruginibacter sp.]